MASDARDSGAQSPQFPPTDRRAGGHRQIPNWLFFERAKALRERGEPFDVMTAWCSLSSDLYRNGELGSERAYAALWKRSRTWAAQVMRWFRAEYGLPAPPVGRRPSRRETPDHSGDQSVDQEIDRVSAAYSMPSDNRT